MDNFKPPTNPPIGYIRSVFRAACGHIETGARVEAIKELNGYLGLNIKLSKVIVEVIERALKEGGDSVADTEE